MSNKLHWLLRVCKYPQLRRPATALAYYCWRGARSAYRSRWAYGIQRRTVYLVPPTTADLSWMFAHFHHPEISEMFGYEQLGAPSMLIRYRAGTLVVAIIKAVATRKRIGFLVMYPPATDNFFWEFGYAIPDPADRNAFHALNTHDAVGHYMFEHLNVPLCGSRSREDNHAANAVIKRLGYTPVETRELDGHKYAFFAIDQEGWKKRREKLARGEERENTGRPLFHTLPAPYDPVV